MSGLLVAGGSVRARGVVLTVGGTAIAVAGALAVVDHPIPVAGAVAGLAVLCAMVLRVEWAMLAYVAVEPFGDYLSTLVGPAVKLVGGVLFLAWCVRLAVDHRPVLLRHRAMWALGAFALVLVASSAWHPRGAAGFEVVSRYASYLAVVVVLVDTMRTRLPARRVVFVFVVACTAAAAVGVGAFVRHGGGRAAGPMADANDFAFYLVCALPFAVLFWRERRGWPRWLWGVAIVLLLTGIAATFSRGAILAVAAMVVVSLVVGLVRLRHVLVGAAVLGIIAAAAAVPLSGVIERSLAEKQYVADANVVSRFASWTLAAEITADHPILGAGPGGFRSTVGEYEQRRFSDTTHLDVVHQMELEVSSELGLVGLAAFTTMIGAALMGALRGRRNPRGTGSRFASAVVVATTGTLVAAIFLSEQYYLPIWLLVALGVVTDTVPGTSRSTTITTATTSVVPRRPEGVPACASSSC